MGPVPVGGRNDRSIRKNLHAWIGAVPAFVVLFQKDPVIAQVPLDEVFVMTDPSDPTVGRRTGITLAWDITKRHKKSTIGKVLGRMPIARKRIG